MNETQTNLDLKIGKKEAERLKPEKVKIVKIEIVPIGERKNEKVTCWVKHPNREEEINISSVKYESPKGKLEVSGLWFNKDEDGMIRKGSALAVFLQHTGSETLKQLSDKELDTVLDDNGYLCFKAY